MAIYTTYFIDIVTRQFRIHASPRVFQHATYQFAACDDVSHTLRNRSLKIITIIIFIWNLDLVLSIELWGDIHSYQLRTS